jgi:hypothetical protein
VAHLRPQFFVLEIEAARGAFRIYIELLAESCVADSLLAVGLVATELLEEPRYVTGAVDYAESERITRSIRLPRCHSFDDCGPLPTSLERRALQPRRGRPDRRQFESL